MGTLLGLIIVILFWWGLATKWKFLGWELITMGIGKIVFYVIICIGLLFLGAIFPFLGTIAIIGVLLWVGYQLLENAIANGIRKGKN